MPAAGCTFAPLAPSNTTVTIFASNGTCMASALWDAAMAAPNATDAELKASADYTGTCPGATVALALESACSSIDCSAGFAPTALTAALSPALGEAAAGTEEQCVLATSAELCEGTGTCLMHSARILRVRCLLN